MSGRGRGGRRGRGSKLMSDLKYLLRRVNEEQTPPRSQRPRNSKEEDTMEASALVAKLIEKMDGSSGRKRNQTSDYDPEDDYNCYSNRASKKQRRGDGRSSRGRGQHFGPPSAVRSEAPPRSVVPQNCYSCPMIMCNATSNDLLGIRDHYISAHLPLNFFYNPVKKLIEALIFLAQEFTGVGSLVEAGRRIQQVRPIGGTLVWTTPEKAAVRGVYRHFVSGPEPLKTDELCYPGQWTLLNWECLAHMVYYLDSERYSQFCARFQGNRHAPRLSGITPTQPPKATITNGTSSVMVVAGLSGVGNVLPVQSIVPLTPAPANVDSKVPSGITVATTSSTVASNVAPASGVNSNVPSGITVATTGPTASVTSNVPQGIASNVINATGQPSSGGTEATALSVSHSDGSLQAVPAGSNSGSLGRNLERLDLSERREVTLEVDPYDDDDDILDLKVKFFDSHFHLDRMARKLELFRELTFSHILDQAEQQLNRNVSDNYSILHAIAIFCDPLVHKQLLANQNLLKQVHGDRRLFTAFGLHPKKTEKEMDRYNVNSDCLNNLSKLLRTEKVVAFGEVGLDNTVSPKHFKDQEEALIQVLRHVRPILIERRLPVVVHSRQGVTPRGKRDVTAKLIEILEQELGLHHPIQVHFFTGFMAEFRAWMKFQNVVFSVPVRSEVRGESIPSLRSIPLDRLLLETDAPYSDGYQLGSPFDIPAKCRALAEVLDLSEEELLKLTTHNAMRFFNISPSSSSFQDPEEGSSNF